MSYGEEEKEGGLRKTLEVFFGFSLPRAVMGMRERGEGEKQMETLNKHACSSRLKSSADVTSENRNTVNTFLFLVS